MAHSHPVYDSDPHFTIDPISRSITNAGSKKTILMQNDHNSERFSFEIPRLVEGHDITLCNKVEIHYTNADTTKQGTNYGVYEVEDMIIDPCDSDRVVFTWLISENATRYAGSLSFIVMFSCIENGDSVYRWNTAINATISIAKGMNNGEAISEAYPDILVQWKDELFKVASGGQLVSVGPVEPDSYPYIWLDTSEYMGTTEKNLGYLTIKMGDGISQRVYPVVKLESLEGLTSELKKITDQHAKDIAALEKSIPTELKNPKSINFTGAATGTYDGSEEVTIDIPEIPTAEELLNGNLNSDLNVNGTLTATKIVGAVYM